MAICTPYIDTSVGRVTTALSTSRPTGSDLYAGKYVYETDTGRTVMYDGTGWVIQNEPAQSFTPTWASGVTTTGGTNTGTYHRSDGYIDLSASFTLGVGSAISGNVTLTLPIVGATGLTGANFEVLYLNSSASHTYIGIVSATTTTLTLLASQVEAAAATVSVYSAALAANVPFRVAAAAENWGTGDAIYVAGRYRMTTRYS